MKSRQMAEIQVSFNEAINSVTKEKDSVIEMLRTKVAQLEGNLVAIKFHFEKFSEPSAEAATLLLSRSECGASSSSSSHEEHRRTDPCGQSFEKLKLDIEPHLQVTDRLVSVHEDPKHSEEQIKKIKLCSRTKMSPCIDCSFKISILSCNEGDLILLCYEEKHESFAVFHFGQFVHFLHTDSLHPLGLKIPADPSERWALGVVTSKEFCVARKPFNRYKISLGAKFYRVKVKPWEREKALRCHQVHHHRGGRPPSQVGEEEEVSSRGMSASSI